MRKYVAEALIDIAAGFRVVGMASIVIVVLGWMLAIAATVVLMRLQWGIVS